jgi:hypothetical protein
MKIFYLKISLFVFFIFAFASGFSQTANLSSNTPTNKIVKNDINTLVRFTNDNYDMGKIPSGKSLEYNISVTNIGADTISIKNVLPQCGCTTPKYAKGQILKPGETTMVTLGFNGQATGIFNKSATISFGNGMSKQVLFKGEAVK